MLELRQYLDLCRTQFNIASAVSFSVPNTGLGCDRGLSGTKSRGELEGSGLLAHDAGGLEMEQVLFLVSDPRSQLSLLSLLDSQAMAPRCLGRNEML